MDLINQINLSSKFMGPIEPINRLVQAHSNVHQKIQQLQKMVFILVELWAWTHLIPNSVVYFFFSN